MEDCACVCGTHTSIARSLSCFLVKLSLWPSMLSEFFCWQACVHQSLFPFVINSLFQCLACCFFKLVCPRASGHKNTGTSGDDNPAIKLGTLSNRSYSLHLLPAHYCAGRCLWATRTIPEVFDCTAFNRDALLYVMIFWLHSNPSNTIDVRRLCHSYALCRMLIRNLFTATYKYIYYLCIWLRILHFREENWLGKSSIIIMETGFHLEVILLETMYWEVLPLENSAGSYNLCNDTFPRYNLPLVV